jgi:hypothetical protein
MDTETPEKELKRGKFYEYKSLNNNYLNLFLCPKDRKEKWTTKWTHFPWFNLDVLRGRKTKNPSNRLI